MHRWILINMPYSVTYVNSACFPSTIKCAPHAISFHLLKNFHRLCNYKMFAKSLGRRFIFFVLMNLKKFKPLIYNQMTAYFKTRKHKLGPHKKCTHMSFACLYQSIFIDQRKLHTETKSPPCIMKSFITLWNVQFL